MGNPVSDYKKSLGLFDATALVIGSMIGSGIFIVSADIARQVGSTGLLLIVWVITATLTIIVANTYGELSSKMPGAGGQYVYLRTAYNPMTGFLYGWTLFLVIQTGTIAAVAMAFAKFFGVLVPWFAEKNVLLDVGFLKINSSQLLAIFSIALLTYLNSRGIKLGKWVQNSFTVTKVLVMLAFLIIGLFIASSADAISINQATFWDACQTSRDGKSVISLTGFAVIAAIGTAMVGSIFSADAWNNITFAGSEVKNARKNIPLSLFLGTLIVSVIYILVNIVYIRALPLKGLADGQDVMTRGIQFAADERVGTAAMSNIFGAYAAIIMAIFIMISTFGCNNGLILSGARVYQTMANDKLFFNKAGALNKNNVPGAALWLQGIWASVLCLSGRYGDLLDYVVFAVLLFYVLSVIGTFILRKKIPHEPTHYKAFGFPVFQIIYIIVCLIIMGILLVFKSEYTWPGLIIVLIGIPVYYLWRKKP
jgi:APA family basic amino acid/polyamine antiporter